MEKNILQKLINDRKNIREILNGSLTDNLVDHIGAV